MTQTKPVNLNLDVKTWKQFQKLMIDKNVSASKMINELMKKELIKNETSSMP